MEPSRTTISCSRIAAALLPAMLLAPVLLAQEAAQKPPFGVRWSVPIPAPPMFPPVVAGARVYLTHLPGLLVAYDTSDGREQWRVDTNPVQPPVLDGELAFVASEHSVQALRLGDGGVEWRVTADRTTAPLLAKDGWVIAATATTLQALRARDGARVWEREAVQIHEAAAIAGDVLFVPSNDGWVRAYQLLTGEPQWQRRVGGSASELLIVGDRVYFGSTDKHFYCLDAGTGEIKWRFRVGAALYSRATTDGERVIFAGLDNLVRALDRSHGALRWQQGVPFRPLAGPLAVGGVVAVAGVANEVRLFRSNDGTRLPPVPFPEKLGIAPVVSESSNGLVVVAATGSLAESWKLTLVEGMSATASSGGRTSPRPVVGQQ